MVSLSLLISEVLDVVACVTPLLHILIMATAIWQLTNENDVACAIAGFNVFCHCQVILVLIQHELVVVTSLAIRAVIMQMHWAHEYFSACCGGLVCEDECLAA